MNKYVEFVSDEDFLECVRKVVEAYESLDRILIMFLNRRI